MGDNSDKEFEEVSEIKREEDFTSEHSGVIISGINRFRTSKAFCDAELEVEDQIFPVHKCVLASVSDFFFTLFSTELVLEKQLREKHLAKIPIGGVSATTMHDILEFIYSSKITISEDNVYDILAAANYTMMPKLKQFCSKFLLGDEGKFLSPGNAIETWSAGRRYNAEKLEAESGRYIASHYDLIRKESSLLKQETNEVKDILKLKNAKENCEEAAFRLLVDWVNHDTDNRKDEFPKLFFLLELTHMSSQYLAESVASEELVLNFHDCTKRVVTSLSELTAFSYSRSIVVFDRRHTRIRMFDTGNKRERIIIENSSLGGHAKAVKVKDHLYVLGDEKQYSSSLKKLNLKASPFTWENETAMPEEMANISASAMDVYIFAIGTTNIVRQGNLQLMVSYDSTTKQWTTIRHEKRLNFPIPVEIDITTLTSESGCVFNLHGKYYFDAKTKSFKEAPRTSYTVNLIQVGATVYLFERGAGYYDPLQLLMYNPDSKDLCKISTMQNVDTVEKCCLLNGNIVAILRSVNNDFEMKEFNVLTKSWKVIAEIPNIAYFQTIL